MSDSAQTQAEISGRREARSGLFLAALVKTATGLQSVRIRNISSGGALIETNRPPKPADSVELVRAQNNVSASVAWSRERMCGLKFDRPICVESWVPSLSPHGQMKIDSYIQDFKQGLNKEGEQPSFAAAEQGLKNSRIAEEIAALSRQVELSLDELAGFAPAVVRLPNTLQQLEVVAQTLGHLGRLLGSDDPLSLVNQLGMDDLKRRLLR